MGNERSDWLVVGPYPSEKYESNGMIILNIWANKKCSKPPTRVIDCRLSIVLSIWVNDITVID